ncbi:tripartite motif-containing protein 2-like isoform X2 [Saccostrea cucullata]|uniref:tripartite motif-containing protein 2-like isoform X2 n=1 Tax=Saccostrea cuccullata TaxID=36930 RepID=UPI002ED6748C
MAASTTKAQDVILCHLCDRRPALLHCNPCQVNLCEECVGKHYMTSSSSNHEIVKYRERKFHLSFPNCKAHSGEKCSVKCQNCDEEVCIKCLSGAHNGHRIIEIKDIVEEKKKCVEKDTSCLKDIIPKFEKADIEIESKLAALNAKCDELERSVTDHGQKWQRLIEEIVAKNKKDIAEIRGNGIEKLKEYQKEIKNALENLNEIALQNRKISQSMDVSHITKYKSNIQKYLKIPLRIDVELPDFVSKDIDKDKLYQDFGKLVEPKIQTETIYRSDVSNDLLDKAVEIAAFQTGITRLMRIACLNTEEMWVSGENIKSITRFNIQGSVQETVTSTCLNQPSDISVSKEGHLLYTDAAHMVINDVHQTTAQLTAPQGWEPVGLCFTQSGDVLVTICTHDEEHYKIVRYEGQTIKQEIEKDDRDKPLYKGGDNMLYVTKNNNGDICASDCNAGDVVVVDKAGKLRFRYKGQQTMKKQFEPSSIVTDSAGRIIIQDHGNSCTHIIDQDGQFLRSLDFCGPLSVDTLGRLWVGEYKSGIVKVIKYTK